MTPATTEEETTIAVMPGYFAKTSQVNLKNKPKIGSLTEKQAQNALPEDFNKTKNQQKIQIKNQGGKCEETSPK